MRFKNIEAFHVDELNLDEGNYRFRSAEDQNQCISKIHDANASYFKNLMESVAEDDLGELLLAYKDTSGQVVVLDGNRRLSALKVLRDPSLSPTSSVRKHAEALNKKFDIDFDDIQAQVSSDRSLIMKTVYEHHASGKGKARINWSALGAARFRFEEGAVQADSDEWKSMALLFEAESQKPSITPLLESKKFSYETFRRIARKAIELGYISKDIFSTRDKRIKRSAKQHLLDDALQKAITFLESIKQREISLSRNETFADVAKVEKYLEQFDLAPENKPAEPDQSQSLQGGAGEPDGDTNDFGAKGQGLHRDNGDTGNSSDTDDENDGSGESGSDGKPGQGGYGITRSSKIEVKLKELNSPKLIQLYDSLCVVSLRHSTLLHTGAWAFFESLATLALPSSQNPRGTK